MSFPLLLSLPLQGFSVEGVQVSSNESSVVNYNKKVRSGDIKVKAVSIAFKGHTPSKVRDLVGLKNWYKGVSRGKVNLKGANKDSIDVRPSVTFKDISASCANRTKARNKVYMGNYGIKIYGYTPNVCGYTANAGSNKINMNRGIRNKTTLVHETGHLFSLGHSVTLKTRTNRSKSLYVTSKERTTNMGGWGNSSFNAPQLHWLDFVEDDEVVSISPSEFGSEYTLRAINGNQPGDEPIALVFEIPETGDRLFLSVPKNNNKLSYSYKNQFDGVVLHMVGKCKNSCRLQRTVHVGTIRQNEYYKHGVRHDGVYIDDTGLKIEIIEKGNDWRKVKLRITKVEKNAQQLSCSRPLLVEANFKRERDYNMAIDKPGKGKLTVTVTNQNDANCRPVMRVNERLFVQRDSKLSKITEYKAGIKSYGFILWSGDSYTQTATIESREQSPFDVQFEYGSLPAQSVEVSFSDDPEPVDVEYSQIKSDINNKCLNIRTSKGSKNVTMFRCHSGDNQQWIYDEEAGTIKSAWGKTAGLCLDVTKNKNIQMYKCHGQKNQQFDMLNNGEIRDREYDMCLDIHKGNVRDGANVQAWKCHGRMNQKWYMNNF